MIVEFADADEAVAVPVGAAVADPVSDHAGEGGRFRPRGGRDHDAALRLRRSCRTEVVTGVDRPAGPPVEQHHGLAGGAALHHRGDLRDVDRGLGRPCHRGVGAGEVQPSARPGQHDPAEVEQQQVVLITALEQRRDPRIRLGGAGIVQVRHVEPAEPAVPQRVAEHGNIRGRHREPAQNRIVLVLDRHHHCQSSAAHRITLHPWCDARACHETPR
ncbi:hypothetical protein [Actinoplanes sp. OR16]|uniref:hypothetical protein n=1 Tax=Actinoplanes sp. OR16 TaxID=946334 RepID=UPI000FDB9ACA|nr:hypothetical protein [Actinoplanes sp. OR16]